MNENYANLSNLAAVDHLGRKLPAYEDVGETKKDKIVGLFYYLWLGYHGTQGPFDITKILEKQPDAMYHPESPVWPDPSHTPMLHWGEVRPDRAKVEVDERRIDEGTTPQG